jgi:biopolymer transport protein ExbB
MVIAAACAGCVFWLATPGHAQQPAAPASEPAASAPAAPSLDSIRLWEMAVPWGKGGVFMWPIYGFSFVVVLFTIERAIGLRRRKILPPELVEALGHVANNQAGFDPRRAYRICQQFPSTAANVIKAMLLKLGRPQPEIDAVVEKAKEVEAAKLYNNIRPLNLSATAAPLLGLLGTVQGMIVAFWATARLPEGANKAAFLADGVYTALITTFAGLCVAIPAVCVSHFLEGHIQRRFHEIDALIWNLMPQLERFEGKLRVSRQQLAGERDGAERPEPADKPQPAPAATQ